MLEVEELKIVAIGDEDAVAGFKLAGVSEGKVAKTPEEVEAALKEAARDEEVAVVIITEDVASKAPSLLQELYLRPRPAIVEVPSKSGAVEEREDPIRELLRRAIGVEVSVG
ncbi:MAG: V-type ATP synthase subunit F [Thermoprotei archaeon]|nr:MAG: V-type ATP synthase subunit F [Thermoprotei archaeon]RLF18540.1 MAG: V-type ATP synthase subunit F [Thermoprotei archaeon]